MPTVADALTILERHAPLTLAGSWDNVGLLLEPTPAAEIELTNVALAIDLSPAVAREVVAQGAQLLIAYHPPIFGGLKHLTQRDPRQADLLRLAREGIAIYSPHTALDAVVGGVNDWLADAFEGTRTVLQPDVEAPDAGQGRRIELARPLPLDDACARIRSWLGLDAIRVAASAHHAEGEPIRSIALCPGAGGDVIGANDADLLWTGEMRHHDVLAAQASGRSVVLCEHTNTERGYLPRWAERLRADLDGVSVHICQEDRDPLDWRAG